MYDLLLETSEAFLLKENVFHEFIYMVNLYISEFLRQKVNHNLT